MFAKRTTTARNVRTPRTQPIVWSTEHPETPTWTNFYLCDAVCVRLLITLPPEYPAVGPEFEVPLVCKLPPLSGPMQLLWLGHVIILLLTTFLIVDVTGVQYGERDNGSLCGHHKAPTSSCDTRWYPRAQNPYYQHSCVPSWPYICATCYDSVCYSTFHAAFLPLNYNVRQVDENLGTPMIFTLSSTAKVRRLGIPLFLLYL